MGIIKRSEKGSPLSYDEMDNNFEELDIRPSGQTFPSTSTVGLQLSGSSETDFGWHDLIGHLYNVSTDLNAAEYTSYRGGIRAFQFDETDEAFVNFHMPHDYLLGSDIFMHVHWSHNSSTITGGTVTWGFEVMYAKGFDQAAFNIPVITTVAQTGSTIPYRHMIAETPSSVAGGSAGVLLDSNLLEVDGIFQVRVFLDSNDLETSDASTPKPFAHFVDVHYQSTGLPTINKAPDFWE